MSSKPQPGRRGGPPAAVSAYNRCRTSLTQTAKPAFCGRGDEREKVITFSNIDVAIGPVQTLTLQVTKAGPNAGKLQIVNAAASVVPEPSTSLLFGLALLFVTSRLASVGKSIPGA